MRPAIPSVSGRSTSSPWRARTASAWRSWTPPSQSVDPELLYCWTYGEEHIAHTHKVWENFSHRRPIEGSAQGPDDHLKWVN